MNDKNQSQGQTQNAQEKKPWYKKWWVIAIGILFLYSIGSNAMNNASKQAGNQKQEPATQTQTDSQNKQETQKTAVEKITITSAELAKAYSDNEVSADDKYKGKLLEVSGKITGIDNGISDNEMVVRLTDGASDFNSVTCYMKSSEREKVLAFKKGQTTILIGTGSSATLSSPVVKDCLVK